MLFGHPYKQGQDRHTSTLSSLSLSGAQGAQGEPRSSTHLNQYNNIAAKPSGKSYNNYVAEPSDELYNDSMAKPSGKLYTGLERAHTAEKQFMAVQPINLVSLSMLLQFLVSEHLAGGMACQ